MKLSFVEPELILSWKEPEYLLGPNPASREADELKLLRDGLTVLYFTDCICQLWGRGAQISISRSDFCLLIVSIDTVK